MNNGKYETDEYKRKIQAAIDNRLGPKIKHTKVCEKCGTQFTWIGREKTKQFRDKKFCSRSCSNYRGEGLTYAKELVGYRTICFAHHGKKCIVCGFDKIVEAHHVDENKKNNKPKNLVPLCPNHHEMRHTDRYRDEIEKSIQEYLKNGF